MASYVYLGDGPLVRSTIKKLNPNSDVYTVFSNRLSHSTYQDFIRALQNERENLANRIDVLVISWKSLKGMKVPTDIADILTQINSNKVNIGQVVFLSSVSVYGSCNFPANEQSSIRLENSYAEEKYKLEILLSTFFPTNLKILRISNVFGDLEFDDLPNRILKSVREEKPLQIFSPSEISRDYISLENFSDIFFRLLEVNVSGQSQVYNLASGISTNLDSIVSYMKTNFAFSYEVKEIASGVIRRSEINIELLEQILNLKFKESSNDLFRYINKELSK